MWRLIVLAIGFGLFWSTPGLAHTGAVDAYGCHSNKALYGTSSVRECHTGLLAGLTFSSTTAEYKAYITAQTTVVVDLQAKLDACTARCPAVGTVKLHWLANAEPDLKGYKLYCGFASRVYSIRHDVGLVLTGAAPNLPVGQTVYCAVTAYDKTGNESAFSAELTKVVTP